MLARSVVYHATSITGAMQGGLGKTSGFMVYKIIFLVPSRHFDCCQPRFISPNDSPILGETCFDRVEGKNENQGIKVLLYCGRFVLEPECGV